MNVFSKLFNMISVLFILLSTVSFCIETLPAYDDSYVNEGGAKFENKKRFGFQTCENLSVEYKNYYCPNYLVETYLHHPIGRIF